MSRADAIGRRRVKTCADTHPAEMKEAQKKDSSGAVHLSKASSVVWDWTELTGSHLLDGLGASR